MSSRRVFFKKKKGELHAYEGHTVQGRGVEGLGGTQ